MTEPIVYTPELIAEAQAAAPRGRGEGQTLDEMIQESFAYWRTLPSGLQPDRDGKLVGVGDEVLLHWPEDAGGETGPVPARVVASPSKFWGPDSIDVDIVGGPDATVDFLGAGSTNAPVYLKCVSKVSR